MNDEEFFQLKLRATIVPGQARWPAPEYLHWQRLHETANEARERVSKAYVQMDAIDGNADLSPDGKYRMRSKTAAQAIAELEESKTLVRAREAVDLAVTKHNVENVSPEIAEARDATVKAMKEAEQGWRKAADTIGERASLIKGPVTRR